MSLVAPVGLRRPWVGMPLTGCSAAPPLVMAGWSAVPLANDDDPWGVDPDQTVSIN